MILNSEYNAMYYKYPRTLHTPWSPGGTRDDRILSSMDHFIGKQVIVTEKMDGENTTLYNDHVHARSIASGDHPSRSWVKALQGRIATQLPEKWRVCGENLFAQHSIGYKQLASYFLVFSIWNEDNFCLDWDTTMEWCELLDLEHVPVLYIGLYDEIAIKSCWKSNINKEESEGYVIRLRESFAYDNFNTALAKYVRAGHITTDEHWKFQEIVPNKLKLR